MSTLDDLKIAIASYLGKSPSDFISGSTDLLLLAINNAKKWAQSQRDFEACRTQAKVTVSLASGVALTSVTLLDGTTAVRVKTIEAAYLMWNDQTLKPINYIDRKTQSSDLRQRLKGWPYRQTLDSPPIDFSNSLGTEDTPNLFLQGSKLYLWPATNAAFNNATSMVTSLDVVQWLPDYTSTSTVTAAGAGTAGYNGAYVAYGIANGQTLYICVANSTILFWLNDYWWIVPVEALSTSVSPTTSGYKLSTPANPATPILSPVPSTGSYSNIDGTTSGFITTSQATVNVGTDWFLDNGFEFLMWKSIVDGNYLWEKFAQAQEGYLQSPEKWLQSAWTNLQYLDGGIVGQNTTAFDLA